MFAKLLRRLLNSPRFIREHRSMLFVTHGACGRTEWTENAWRLLLQRRK